MREIISDIITVLRVTTVLIRDEPQLKFYIFKTMSEALGDMLVEIDQTVKQNRNVV
ncbi:hypothetical protein DES38_10972 [Streptohalobacillus salinus]|uniref:Uncharacterized protein n=1 Tax=Streptohalobacillus salinus TaxID=621096 RepID=A0A2V3W9K7_9BACI|nr:hypothetical protein [Streptohalobacillus salinus]PXW89834.1 hypothetical protein DES38_10972 [Streptohalobacillus salinus]